MGATLAEASIATMATFIRCQKTTVLALFKFSFSGMQQYFASGSTTLLLFSFQLARGYP
jgi:hypothetical protein